MAKIIDGKIELKFLRTINLKCVVQKISTFTHGMNEMLPFQTVPTCK